MVRYIDEHKSRFGAEPICQMLPIVPSTYYEEKARERDPARLLARAQRDAQLRPMIHRVWRENWRVYGVPKVWKQLKREGISVARCTVQRLMRQEGLKGVARGDRTRTTIADDKLETPLDRVQRRFTASRPNQLRVSNFTFVATWAGFVYVAFVIDVFSRRIVG